MAPITSTYKNVDFSYNLLVKCDYFLKWLNCNNFLSDGQTGRLNPKKKSLVSNRTFPTIFDQIKISDDIDLTFRWLSNEFGWKVVSCSEMKWYFVFIRYWRLKSWHVAMWAISSSSGIFVWYLITRKFFSRCHENTIAATHRT